MDQYNSNILEGSRKSGKHLTLDETCPPGILYQVSDIPEIFSITQFIILTAFTLCFFPSSAPWNIDFHMNPLV